jgi:hypothetical protein
MSNLLDGVDDITLCIFENKTDVLFWNLLTDVSCVYTINKANFTVFFKCPDSNCQTIDISHQIEQIIKDKKEKGSFKAPCPGKDNLGRKCIAGIEVRFDISYL